MAGDERINGRFGNTDIPKLKGNLTAIFQHADYHYAAHELRKSNEDYFGIGAGVTYDFTRWISAEANYYFDNRDSSIVGGVYDYTRNRVFLGVRFRY